MIKSMIADQRYNVGLEFTGAATQKHVARFCGDFISAHEFRTEAEAAAIQHATERGQNHNGWQLITCVNGVIWLACGKKHRVAYGADVNDYTGKNSDIEAAKQFGLCVLHSAYCEGLIQCKN